MKSDIREKPVVLPPTSHPKSTIRKSFGTAPSDLKPIEVSSAAIAPITPASETKEAEAEASKPVEKTSAEKLEGETKKDAPKPEFEEISLESKVIDPPKGSTSP
jgi:hypothetical protein